MCEGNTAPWQCSSTTIHKNNYHTLGSTRVPRRPFIFRGGLRNPVPNAQKVAKPWPFFGWEIRKAEPN